jgi:hypothetical protein
VSALSIAAFRVVPRAIVVSLLLSTSACDGDEEKRPLDPPETRLRELFCRSKEARRTGVVADTTIPAPNTRGLNRRNYFISKEYGDTKSLDELRVDNLDDFREASFQRQLQRFLSEARVAWDARSLDTLAAKHDVYENLLRQVGGLARFVNIVDHHAEVDCRANVYRYRVSFWLLKDPLRAVNEEAFREIETHAGRIISGHFDAAGENPRQIVINTDVDLVQPLLSDTALRNQLRNSLRPEDLALLRTYAPDTWQFLQSLIGNTDSVFPFQSGKYQLTGEMAYAIDLVMRTFLRRRVPGEEYQIISRGYADANPITRPIAYAGPANLGLGSSTTEPFSPDAVPRSVPIRDNQQLSVARGFAGAQGISSAFRSEISSAEERNTLQILYAGGGAIPGPIDERNRRIDIIMLRKGEEPQR